MADPKAGAKEALIAGHAAMARHDWPVARDHFDEAAAQDALGGDDHYALAEALFWLGDIDRATSAAEDAYRTYVAMAQPDRAAMAALFLAARSTERGEGAVGSGWMGRVQRLLRDLPEGTEHGYPLYYDLFGALGRGQFDEAQAHARRMQDLGHRFDDPTLVAVGVLGEGRTLIKQGSVDEGLVLLDEAMLAALSDDLHPYWTGAIYCHLLDVCHQLSDLRRAGEWTQASDRWCASMPDDVLFRGICRVHRAQLLQTQGAWDRAEREATTASADLVGVHVVTVAEAHYEVGEIRRLRGDLAGANAAFRRAHELGRDPQPGRALLRLAEGRGEAALASIGSALAAETGDKLARARLLVAQVEIALAVPDQAVARAASEELQSIAAIFGSSGFEADALQAQGAVLLAEGRAGDALGVLRSVCRLWQELNVPYAAGKVRVLLADAYAALGDEDAAVLELDAAHEVFERLGARRDAMAVAERRGRSTLPAGLTPREAEVLRLVAAGSSNREIAGSLFVSEKTVARHLSNIFTKLDLSSRTAAAAFAFEHGLASPRG
jgi:ATP/maltotriose-dependent transcriptional regulator MalT